MTHITPIYFVVLVTVQEVLGHKRAGSDITYQNIAFSDYFPEFNTSEYYNNGLVYKRARSPMYNQIIINEQINVFLENGIIPGEDYRHPDLMNHPGIGIFDFDKDGDLDVFISNGPDTYHSLFSNQMIENGGKKSDFGQFIDVGATSGFGDSVSFAQDGSGVCFGDINNDGYSDLLVLGKDTTNLMYINNCDGTFTLLSDNGIDNKNKTYNSTSCSFGDINNDGFIDVFIGNSINLDDETMLVNQLFIPVPGIAFSLNEPNELYINNGDLTFNDVSHRVSGTTFPDDANNGKNGITWAVTMVDVNDDGLVDMIEANDQLGPYLPGVTTNRGISQLWLNDVENPGYFINKQIVYSGSWMGVAMADLNCDESMDLYMTNTGSYKFNPPNTGPFSEPSKWFFNNGETSVENVDFVSNADERADFSIIWPFGWGCVIYDFDLDADLDILMHGGLDGGFGILETNAGTMWRNDGDGCFNLSDINVVPPDSIFSPDPNCDGNGIARRGCTYHTRRNVRGLAIGDLNNDGLYDIVTTADHVYGSQFDLEEYIEVETTHPYDNVNNNNEILYNSSFWIEQWFLPDENGDYIWTGKETLQGDLFVEIAQVESQRFKNNYFKLLLQGSKGLLASGLGNVNRDAIGAIVNVDVGNSMNSNTVTLPITGGESHLSQPSMEKIFGLARKTKGDITIKWPRGNGEGGYNVNKFDGVKKNEQLILYEIPCDYDTRNDDFAQYSSCVGDALTQLYLPKNQYKLAKRICRSMGISRSNCNAILNV